MPKRKSYEQFCGLARALDHVGDRWTLLVVRELLVGPKTFRELSTGLPGISPSLLTERLSALVSDRLAQRSDAPARSKAVEYRLTEAGAALEPAVLELIRWGGLWMNEGPGTDLASPTWAPLALRALLQHQPAPLEGIVHLDVDGQDVTITARDGRRSVDAGRHGEADAVASLELPLALAVASGERTLQETAARIDGRRRTAAALLEPSPRPRGARGRAQ